jgi:small subunit ribosomal protein S17
MAETTQQKTRTGSRRNTKIGYVVSTSMSKTIVVETTKQKAHPMYRRVISRSKKFYAHDEQNAARVGDVVQIEETRPLSKLKRWRLKNVVQRATLVPHAEEALSGEQKAS